MSDPSRVSSELMTPTLAVIKMRKAMPVTWSPYGRKEEAVRCIR